MLALPPEVFSRLSCDHIDWDQVVECLPTDATLEPMTLRFTKLNGPDEAVCKQVVGPKTGKLTTNFYNKQNMWWRIEDLISYLPEIATATGTLLHFACITTHGKQTLREPIFLVDTHEADDKAAANWSIRNLKGSKVDGEHDAYTYLDLIVRRNREWRAKWEVVEQKPHPLDTIIEAVKSGDITQNELLAALAEIRL